ncbi:DUF4156 domain-containing protein [Tahibacter soli]|jgi:hypothetical protein|uniref:DUF4156 domain-containing protein n=1 Tax=Tahibacter soli TaxID=2983605 RepID=A0A9X3YMU8_9GAMM|nr:DUF4156 domain-containing protein [Tahibacter soli]MDC8014180.1 DUF4156 domain-containing protein [Tahibacter soli]
MKTTRNILLSALLAALGACTWVKLDEPGKAVHVAYDGRVDGCRALGEIGVSVKDRVGPYERNSLKVKDELETLARNEAASMQADTIAAKGEPHDGEQRFGAYACGRRAAAAPSRQQPPASKDGAETYPVKD